MIPDFYHPVRGKSYPDFLRLAYYNRVGTFCRNFYKVTRITLAQYHDDLPYFNPSQKFLKFKVT
jgi:hypothetical protein